MSVHNETGMRLPIRELARMVVSYRRDSGGSFPVMHSDMVQGLCSGLPHLQSIGADIVSLSGAKIGGPRSCGRLGFARFGHADSLRAMFNASGKVPFQSALSIVRGRKCVKIWILVSTH